MSPPANSVHVAAGSKAASGRRVAGSSASSRHAPASRTRSTPNSVRPPQARARTAGVDVVGAQEGEALAVLREVRARVAASGARTSRSASAGRSAPSAARIASASPSTRARAPRSACSSRPARPRPPRGSVEVTVARNWVTGTIGVLTSGSGVGVAVGVGGGASVAAGPDDADGAPPTTAGEAFADADADGPRRSASPKPSCPPVIGTARASASSPSTRTSGRRRTIRAILPEPRRGP